MNKATEQQRTTAHLIWNDLDDLAAWKPVTDADYYAVWGLIHALTNSHGRDAGTYDKWMGKLTEIWSEVKAKYTT
jgi:hypothetical protein